MQKRAVLKMLRQGEGLKEDTVLESVVKEALDCGIGFRKIYNTAIENTKLMEQKEDVLEVILKAVAEKKPAKARDALEFALEMAAPAETIVTTDNNGELVCGGVKYHMDLIEPEIRKRLEKASGKGIVF